MCDLECRLLVACRLPIVVGHLSIVVLLFDTMLFDVVSKCNSLCIYVCKFHMNIMLGA